MTLQRHEGLLLSSVVRSNSYYIEIYIVIAEKELYERAKHQNILEALAVRLLGPLLMYQGVWSGVQAKKGSLVVRVFIYLKQKI